MENTEKIEEKSYYVRIVKASFKTDIDFPGILVVKIQAPNAGCTGLIFGQGTKIYMPHGVVKKKISDYLNKKRSL